MVCADVRGKRFPTRLDTDAFFARVSSVPRPGTSCDVYKYGSLQRHNTISKCTDYLQVVVSRSS